MKFQVTVQRVDKTGLTTDAFIVVEAPSEEAILSTPTDPCGLRVDWADGMIQAVVPSTSGASATVTLDVNGKVVP